MATISMQSDLKWLLPLRPRQIDRAPMLALCRLGAGAHSAVISAFAWSEELDALTRRALSCSGAASRRGRDASCCSHRYKESHGKPPAGFWARQKMIRKPGWWWMWDYLGPLVKRLA